MIGDMVSRVSLLSDWMRTAFVILDHLLDVVIVVKNDTPDLGEGQGTVYAEVLEGSWGNQQKPPDLI